MLDLTLPEAQLLRILTGFFGRERVVPLMSVLAVCGGDLPGDFSIHTPGNGFDLHRWAKESKCLFTIVDEDDRPCLVFEFFSGFSKVIEPEKVEHQLYLKPLLKHLGIRYVTISESEFNEILSPRGGLDFVSFLEAQIIEQD